MQDMKFVVDVMLGRLARWLRLLGYDTIYGRNASDDELFFMAHQQKRILLTRDRVLAQRMNPDYCLLIINHDVREQIKQVVCYYRLNIEDYLFSRCTLCNHLIRTVPKTMAKGQVPDFIYRITAKFYYCDQCQKFYWPGSHVQQARATLSQLSNELPVRE
ncbi:MAG: Mut7-C RNAse domain-containing protein [candidate division KSB1 bacterium]|nr:Mut7-C RNAse domain-containing protein [candidate division KSB1 bacterium]MDZ7317847.1 Mut7-C RNAse domain-containing protein [candidate division KSB1 bacterium]MDZ7340341.1 Mut7-C RNAse domain-containing protein [candidate division KSB1 bacterium]